MLSHFLKAFFSSFYSFATAESIFWPLHGDDDDGTRKQDKKASFSV